MLTINASISTSPFITTKMFIWRITLTWKHTLTPFCSAAAATTDLSAALVKWYQLTVLGWQCQRKGPFHRLASSKESQEDYWRDHRYLRGRNGNEWRMCQTIAKLLFCTVIATDEPLCILRPWQPKWYSGYMSTVRTSMLLNFQEATENNCMTVWLGRSLPPLPFINCATNVQCRCHK